MAPAPKNKVDRLDGPYEAWVFSRTGQDHAGVGGKLSATPFVTALAELPASHPLVTDPGPLMIGTDWAAYRASMWKGGPPLPAGATTFLPLVLQVAGQTGPTASLSDLRQFMAQLAGGTHIIGLEEGPKAHHGFRLNAPLPTSCFDASFATTQREPLLDAKQSLKDELAAEGPTHAAPLVVMAVIDDGLAYAHPALRDGDGEPRMEFCWLQSAEIAPDPAEKTVLFGREHTRQTLSALLAEIGGDEDAFYRKAGSIHSDGMAQALAGLNSHGAHVMHLAAGAKTGAEPQSELDRMRLIGVELPATMLMDTVGFGKDANILAAFHYIFDRADRIAQAYRTNPLPLVINFSFGFTGGPHDGCDRLEDAISQLIAARRTLAPTELVMPAGNHFLASLHGEVSRDNVAADGRFTIPWRIQPDDPTANYLEVWYPAGTAAKPAPPRVRSPSGREIDLSLSAPESATPPQMLWDLVDSGRIVGQASIDMFREKTWRVMVIVAPTETSSATLRGAEAGLWQIGIDASCVQGSDGVIACRIQRDHSVIHPLHRGRQSYFDHPGDPVFAADGRLQRNDRDAWFVRRFGTLNGLATHENVTVVAAVTAQSAVGPDRPAPYSSAGRPGLTPGQPATVKLAAPAEHSPAIRGIPAAGTRSGVMGRIGGTSAAAPQVARAWAFEQLSGKHPGMKQPQLPQQRRPGESDPDDLPARLGNGILAAGQPPDG